MNDNNQQEPTADKDKKHMMRPSRRQANEHKKGKAQNSAAERMPWNVRSQVEAAVRAWKTITPDEQQHTLKVPAVSALGYYRQNYRTGILC